MNTVSLDTQQGYVSSAVQIFELTEALSSAEAALVVWKLRGWLIHNQAKNTPISYRDGRWWTFSSLEAWCKRDFKWLTPRQLGTIMKKLEDMNVIVRRQYGANELKMSYWYSVNEDVIEALIADAKHVNACDESVTSSDKNVDYKKAVKQKQTLNTKKLKSKQQQPLPAESVVVDSLPLSGEHSIEGEGSDTTAVKAFVPHEQHHDERPISKVPLKVLSPLSSDLIKFGVLPYVAQRLVSVHREGDIRRVLEYARAAKNLVNPPGFVVTVLDTGQTSALPAPATVAIGNGEIEAWRLEALRRENERWAVEDMANHQRV